MVTVLTCCTMLTVVTRAIVTVAVIGVAITVTSGADTEVYASSSGIARNASLA